MDEKTHYNQRHECAQRDVHRSGRRFINRRAPVHGQKQMQIEMGLQHRGFINMQHS